jgi:hypothetical protein
MKEQFPRTLPRTTMKEWASLLSAFPLLLGMILTFYNAVRVFRKTGVTGWDFYPIVFGILLMAWTPLVHVRAELLDLRARVKTLEDERVQGK